jgi:predicted MFS family arabinose efflux permease
LSISGTSTQFGLFFAVLIYATPNIAQSTTFHLFSHLAETHHWEKQLIGLGYMVGLIQCILLLLIPEINSLPIIVFVIMFITNLFSIAYIPAIKAYMAHLSLARKGRALSKLNIIQTLAFGGGSLLGGILYDLIGIEKIIFIGTGFSLLSLILLIFVPPILIDHQNNSYPQISHHEMIISNLSNQEKKNLLSSEGKSSLFTFPQALRFQFLLVMVSSVFFGLFAPFLKSIGMGSWFFGFANLGAAILGAVSFNIFGKILDKWGPDVLYLYGWISYSIIYLCLMSLNTILIFIIWMWPAYSFHISTEYLASIQDNKQQAIQDMAKSAFARSFGLVMGVIIGGLIMLWGTFYTVLCIGFFGSLSIGLGSIIFWMQQRKVKKVGLNT